jgi:hypothetical protein
LILPKPSTRGNRLALRQRGCRVYTTDGGKGSGCGWSLTWQMHHGLTRTTGNRGARLAYVFLEDGALLNAEKFEERFSATRMARDYVTIYERLINDRSLFENSLENGYHLNTGINCNMIDLQKKPRTTVSYVPGSYRGGCWRTYTGERRCLDESRF